MNRRLNSATPFVQPHTEYTTPSAASKWPRTFDICCFPLQMCPKLMDNRAKMGHIHCHYTHYRPCLRCTVRNRDGCARCEASHFLSHRRGASNLHRQQFLASISNEAAAVKATHSDSSARRRSGPTLITLGISAASMLFGASLM